MPRNMPAQHQALVAIFGARYGDLTADQRANLREDVADVARDEEVGPLSAAALLRDRIGGVEALNGYARALSATIAREI